MNKLLPLLFLCLFVKSSFAQVMYEDFESGVPVYFSSNVSGALSIKNLHKKKGAQSLSWNTKTGDVLSISGLGISTADIYNYAANAAQFWIYSKSATKDTLVFRFYDTSNNLKREGRIVLNYTGWRDFHRSYRYDYNNGTEQPGFPLNKITVTYKGYQGNTNANEVFMDEMTFAKNGDVRVPGPQNGDDYQHFRFTSNYTQAILSYQNQPDLPVTTATSSEIIAIHSLRNQYQRTVGSANASQIATAKTYVTGLNITTNPDGTLNGKGIYDIYKLDTLLKISNYVAYLSRAYVKNNDADALAKLNAFIPYLIEQGLAEGGRVVIPYNDYSSARNFPIGFLEALPLLSNTAVKESMVKMLKWSHEFNNIYNPSPTPGLELDYMYLKSNLLLELALLGADNNLVARDLKSFSRYLEQYTYTGEGGRDGIKIDGSAFHHQTAYLNYLYSYTSWISRAYELKGSPFRISSVAYNNMKKALKTLLLQTSKGTLIPHAASGRAPFTAAVPVNAASIEKFIEVGGDLIGQAYDTDMAQFYNYIYQSNKYPVTAINLDGYHQLNYAQTGTYRKGNWIAVSKGLTDRMFGSEIYTAENRYGRYQSYGSLEVLYDGNLASSGYIAAGNGWDWNMMPGTTSVVLPYEDLKPIVSGTASEYQANAYAGALGNWKYGIFGLNFAQNPGNRYIGQQLQFKQSVFTFDSLMVCLGSSISAQNNSGKVISTLFQNIKADNALPIYINQNLQSGAIDQQIDLSQQSVTLINTQGTGYYIPKGNRNLNIFRGNQSSPQHTTNNTSTTASAYASKAWIDHGTSANNSQYNYVVVPATNNNKLNAIAQKVNNGELFQILRQNDSLHVVKSLADTVYAFNSFYANPNIRIGKVSGIDNAALFFVKEDENSVDIKIVSPDLNAVDKAVSGWVSTVKPITINIRGSWNVASNPDNATVNQLDTICAITFNLKDGLEQEIKLNHNILSIQEPEINKPKKASEDTKVYPNPFHSQIKVLIKEYLKEDVKIYDALGRLAAKLDKSIVKPEEENVLDFSFLKAGTYFIVIDKTTQTIIKQ